MEKDYTNLNRLAEKCGFVPSTNRMGQIELGIYTLKGYEAPVDLTECPENEFSILKTAVEQLSIQVNESYHNSIERDLLD